MIAVQFWAPPHLERSGWRAAARRRRALVLSAGPALSGRLERKGRDRRGVSVPAAAGIGVLIPPLAVRISSAAGTRQGWAMGGRPRRPTSAGGRCRGHGSLFALAPPLPFLIAGGLILLWLPVRLLEGAARRMP